MGVLARVKAAASVVALTGIVALVWLGRDGSLPPAVWSALELVYLIGLPFIYGWRFGTPASRRLVDARIGDASDFRSAGLSDER